MPFIIPYLDKLFCHSKPQLKAAENEKKQMSYFLISPFFRVTLDNIWKNTQCLLGDVCA